MASKYSQRNLQFFWEAEQVAKMSKFVEKLHHISERGSRPVGFRTTPASLSQSMLLIAVLSQSGIDKVAEIASCGVDAIITPLEDPQREIQDLPKIASALGGIPLGVWPKSVDKDRVEQLAQAKCDFIILEAATTSAAVLEQEELGKVIRMDFSLDDSLVKATSFLPLDAVLIEWAGDFLTIYDLMHYRRIFDLIAKPILLMTHLEPKDDDLRILWEIGVKGIVVEEWSKSELMQLHQEIKRLPSVPKRLWEKRETLLPRLNREISSLPCEEV